MMTSYLGRKGWAACHRALHLAQMLDEMAGESVIIMNVERRKGYRCECGEAASYFIRVVDATVPFRSVPDLGVHVQPEEDGRVGEVDGAP